MSIIHHPTDATLAAFASGTLDEARGLVVATHLSLCAQCRNGVRAFEHIGGALLDALDPAPMSEGALERATARLSQLGAVSPTVRAAPARATARLSQLGAVSPTVRAAPARASAGLPAPLLPYALGPWRRIGWGVQWRPVDVPSDDGVRVFMLRAAPGTRLPRHRHTGTEWTCVFEGAFRHDLGRYGPGDFDEADETVEHNPMVEDGPACICLVALQGNIRLQNWLGRLIQPFVRI